MLEGVFARGDRKVGKVIEEAYRLGCLYDSWSESFDNEKWMQAFANTGVDIEFYTMRERSMDELFPWDFIDIGVTKKLPEKRMGESNERTGYSKLQNAVFRMWCGKIWRRCLF